MILEFIGITTNCCNILYLVGVVVAYRYDVTVISVCSAYLS